MKKLKCPKSFDLLDEFLVKPKIISDNMRNLLCAMVTFIHQALVPIDYTLETIEEAFCHYPELTAQLCTAFELRFDPSHCNVELFSENRKLFLSAVAQINTENQNNDIRRKNIFLQGINFISHTLKTNFYCFNYTALSFRLDPNYLNELPFDRLKKFPELPFAIFFIQGVHFFGFHIRFKNLARGGLRTVYPEQTEQMIAERNDVFAECYNLAWTQHKKNKDIPEGGAKGIIFLHAISIDRQPPRKEQRLEYLYQSQRAFVESLITLVNCDSNGQLRENSIIDYWKQPEYIYLGPDENMHNSMIEWIANFSKQSHYRPGSAFISSKPVAGINHKQYGVTSLGINVYMHKVLEHMGIHPEKDVFRIKMTGGPDGDVAGNQLLNLHRFYPKTAKVIALTDGTGTIHEPQGLNLAILKDLFHQTKGICFYPPEHLSSGSFLVLKETMHNASDIIQETLCYRKVGDKVIEDWLSIEDANHLLHHNVHSTQTEIFIPAGGRPRTLNETNIEEFLDPSGYPTSRAIIEGANLYFDEKARRFLENKGVLIIKDSSANKGGVICSSFEVLCNLTIDEETFEKHKNALVAEILDRVKLYSGYEADLLLNTHKKTGELMTSLSDRLSHQINQYTYQILDYLDPLPLSNNTSDPLIECFLDYAPPTLRNNYTRELLNKIPDHHKKAIIASRLASQMVYKHGIDWSPSIIDILKELRRPIKDKKTF